MKINLRKSIVLLVAVLMFKPCIAQTNFSGTYTIGTGGTYATFTAALTALRAGTVTGPVVFKVKKQIFSERLRFPLIKGVTETNSITFTSETGKAEDVVITSAGNTFFDHHTIRLVKAKHIIFDRLTVTNSNTAIGSCFWLSKECEGIRINACILNLSETPEGAKTNNNRIGVLACDSPLAAAKTSMADGLQGKFVRDLQITDCIINNGDAGIYLLGDLSAAYTEKIFISGNQINNTTYIGIGTKYGVKELNISGNTIDCSDISVTTGMVPVPPPSQAAAVSVKVPLPGNGSNGIIVAASGFSCNIINNKITLSSSRNLNGTGIQFSGFDAIISGNTIVNASSSGIETALSRGSIFNNMIHSFVPGPSNADVYGLSLVGASNANVFHNSIQMDIVPPVENISSAFFINSGSNINVSNNIFSNTVQGYAISVNTEDAIIKADRNVYYSNGSVLANFNTQVIENLNEWKATTNLDSNSLSILPQFISANNLHTLNAKVDGLGVPSSVVADIDGDLRDPNAPDAGADEFKLIYPEVDIAIKRLVYKRLKGGDNFLAVEIANLGTKEFMNETLSLSFSKNGGSSWSDPEIVTVNLDTLFASSIYTFKTPLNLSVSGPLTLCVRINEPVVLDKNLSNDKFCVDECLGLFDRIYTIGTGGDFIKISDAVKMLEAFPCGIAGPIVFNIKTGTYNEQVNLNPIKGASEINNITFQSLTGKKEDVTITSAAGNTFYNYHTLRFLGAKFFSFKNLSIKNTANEYGVAVLFKESPSNIGLYNCNISVDTSVIDDVNSANRIAIVGTDTGTTTYVYIPPVIRDGTIIDNLVIENCRIVTCDHGIYLGQGTKGFSASKKGNCIVRNNQIIFPALGQSKGLQYGIYADYRNNFILDGNTFDMGKNGNPSNANRHAIHFAVVNNSRITNNVVKNASVAHIGLYSCSNDTVANNTIFSSIDYIGNLENIGLAISFCSNMKIWHNSILMDNTATANSPATTYALAVSNGKGNEMLNNIFSSTGGGYAAALTYTAPAFPFKLSDANNFYFPGGSLGKVNTLATPTLATWITATKQDSNSLNVNPSFKNNLDLHTVSPLLDAKGIKTVLESDIDKEPRNQFTPDIGVDEYIITNYDLGLLSFSPKKFNIGNADVTVTLINHGLLSLKGKTTQISFSIDSGLTWSSPIDYVIQGLETPNSREDALLSGLFKTSEIGVFNLCLKIVPGTIPEDLIRTNELVCDDACVQFKPGVYKVGKQTGLEDFATLAEVRKALVSLACELPGGLIFELSDGIYNETFLLDTNIRTQPGSSLTFRSASGSASTATIVSNADIDEQSSTIKIDGTNNLIFQNLTFENKGKTRGLGVQIQNNSSSITISGCRILVDSVQKGTGISSLSLLNGSDIHIENNILSGGDFGIAVSGNGSQSALPNSYTNNTISATENMGISLEAESLGELSNNRVIMRSENEFGIGIFLSEIGTNAKVNANYIKGAAFTGIFIDDCHPDSAISLTNNMLAAGFAIDLNGNGININKSDDIHLYYNSINYNGANKSSKAIQLKTVNKIRLYNNIFSNAGGGYALYSDGLSGISASDYNDFYSSGTKLIYVGAEFTFPQWQALGKDANSINKDPQFLSTSNLHTSNFELDKKGKFIPSVGFDFDNQPRDAQNPDIGADEFSLGLDIALSAVNTVEIKPIVNTAQEIKISVTNLGSALANNIVLKYSVDGQNIAQENLPSSLAPGATIEHVFSQKWTPTLEKEYNVCAEATTSGDINGANNQLCNKVTVSKVFIGLENKEDALISIYPNPFSTQLKIAFHSAGVLSIYDMLGRKVLTEKIYSGNTNINTQTLASGTYYLRIIYDDYKKVNTFIGIKK